jgi:hypothetical protein
MQAGTPNVAEPLIDLLQSTPGQFKIRFLERPIMQPKPLATLHHQRRTLHPKLTTVDGQGNVLFKLFE